METVTTMNGITDYPIQLAGRFIFKCKNKELINYFSGSTGSIGSVVT